MTTRTTRSHILKTPVKSVKGHFSTLVILNPKSAGGKTQWMNKRIEASIKDLLPHADIAWTTKPRDATTLARNGLKAGYQLIVSGGGDGTLNEVLNGFFENTKLIREDAVLGLLPLGSGKDFLRTLGWKPYLKPAIERLAGKNTMPCDIGLMTYRTEGETTDHHYFINIADIGISYDIMKRVNAFPKTLGTEFAYLQGVVRTLLTYKKRYVELIIDDRHKGTHLITNIAIGNGQSHGGGLRACPDAKIDDGLFDILVVGSLGATDFLKALPKLYRGEKIEHPELFRYRGAHVQILDAEDEVIGVEADGETLGYLPCDIRNLRHKIRFKI